MSEEQIVDAVFEEIAPEKDKHIVMYDTINKHYADFMAYIQGLGIESRLLDHAFTRFCEGMMWTEQGIKNLIARDAMLKAQASMPEQKDAPVVDEAGNCNACEPVEGMEIHTPDENSVCLD